VRTTRDHITYLLDVGLFVRMPAKALHVAMSDPAMRGIHLALTRTAERLAAVLVALSGQRTPQVNPTVPPLGDAAERTLTIEAGEQAAAPETPHFLQRVGPAGSDQPIPVHPPFTIGRTARSDLVLDGADVSRSHCRIAADDENVMISDLNSTSVTFLNDRRIADPTMLKPGDRLRIGSNLLLYSVQPVAAPASMEGTEQRRYHAVKGEP
jgi:hypothetical protein